MADRVFVSVEGSTDRAVVDRLCERVGLQSYRCDVANGKRGLDASIARRNQAARRVPCVVLRDLDHDEECAPTLARRLLPHPAAHMVLAIAVREVEAWLMGDREALAEFLAVRPERVPSAPEDTDHPKECVVMLARRSRRRLIREALVPRPGSGASEGAQYASRIAEFAREHWRPEIAAERCPSLARCIERLRELAARGLGA